MTATRRGNEDVPKIIINDTIDLFLELQSATSKHNSFKAMFDKIASVYFI